MVQLRSILKPADNCGARSVQVIHIYKGFFHKKGTIGDVVLAVVKEAMPNGLVKKKEKKIPSTSYKIIPKKIETFTYNKLSKDGVVDDSMLKNSAYLSDSSIRIEKIFNSKSGARYGKVAGKKLLVSMDDLAKK